MDIVITRCAGLDVHKATVVATVRAPGDGGRRRVVTETFGTMTPDLIALREWLQAFGVTHVALASARPDPSGARRRPQERLGSAELHARLKGVEGTETRAWRRAIRSWRSRLSCVTA